MKHVLYIFTLLVLILHPQTYGQDQTVQFWLKIHDTNGSSDTLTFGNDQRATYDVDNALGEYSSPPDPPGFFAKFISIPGRVNTWGTGIIPKDLRTLPLAYTPLHKDTFCVSMKNDNSDAFNATATLLWPSHAYLADRCDSMYLVDPSGSILPGRIDMFTQDSVQLPDVYNTNGPNPAAPAFKFFIFVYGVNPFAVGVNPEPSLVPTAFSLHQNYPNPFNPVTTIQIDIPKLSDVSLKVYNIIGQEVATLVNDRREPGRYNVRFDASELTSGIYFYKLVASDFVATKKLIIMK